MRRRSVLLTGFSLHRLIPGLILGLIQVQFAASQGIDGLVKKAANGDTASQVSLAEKYRVGLGVEQNYAEALRLYKLAAAKGDPRAQFDLAEVYG